jgi:hypothetical protein
VESCDARRPAAVTRIKARLRGVRCQWVQRTDVSRASHSVPESVVPEKTRSAAGGGPRMARRLPRAITVPITVRVRSGELCFCRSLFVFPA